MDEPTGGLKLLMSYDIKAGEIQKYYQFALGRYLPTLQSLGLEMSEVWHTGYGDYPNRLIAFVSRDRDTLFGILEGETWEALNAEFLDYVTNFSYKVIPYQLGFQI